MLLGIFSLLRINREEFPNVTTGRIRIQTSYRGASPEDVELNVTNKLEDALKKVQGLTRISSTSQENSSSISVTIEEGQDEKKIYNDIVDAVRGVDLPEDASDPNVIEATPNRIAMRIGISSKKLTYKELREYAYQFEKKLKNIRLVGEVTTGGLRAREVRIEVFQDKMMQFGISLNEIIKALKDRNIRESGGSIESFTNKQNIITLSKFQTVEEVKKVIIRFSLDGSIIYLENIADVIDDFVEESSETRVNGATAITFTIAKRDSADIIETSLAVKKLIQDEKDSLPKGMLEFLVIRDDSTSVKDKFEIVKSNGIIGLFLVLIVLAFFLNIRAAFWVAMGIPVSLLGVLALLPLLNIELDSITLAAMVIVLGIIVDDAIVIVENIFQKREEGQGILEAAINGVHEVAVPVFTTVATTIIAFTPMFYIPGRLGRFLYVVPLTVSMALVISMLESYFILPAHILPSLQEERKKKVSRQWFSPIRKRFEGAMHTILEYRYVWVLASILLLFMTGIFALRYMKFSLFSRNRGVESINVTLAMPLGTPLKKTIKKVQEVENIIDQFSKKEIISFYTRVGRGGFRGEKGTHLATIDIFLVSDSQLPRSVEAISNDLRKRFSKVRNVVALNVGKTARGFSAGKPIEIMVKGGKGDNRAQVIQAVKLFLGSIKGVSDVEIDEKEGKEEINIIPNYPALRRYGLSVAEIAQTVRLAYDGQVATITRYGDEDVNFRVIMEKRIRENHHYLRNLKIYDNKGGLVSLKDIAKLQMHSGVTSIYHEDGEPTITVTAEIDKGIITPIEVMNAVKNHFNFSRMRNWSGVRLDIQGEAAESREAAINISVAFAIASLGIYFLLVLLFGSITQPFVVLLSIPFGLSGVIIAFGLHGQMQVSFFAGIGVIGLAGVVVNDSLVMVDHLNTIIKTKSENFIAQVASGVSNRLRPVILTTITTVAGLIPLVYGIGGSDSMMGPMALSLGYGLLFATPMTLIVLPCMYVIGNDIKNLIGKFTGKGNGE